MSADETTLAAEVAAWVGQRCGRPAEEIDRDRPLVEFGLSSVDAVELAGRLEQSLGRTLPATLLWEYPTINALVSGLVTPESTPSPPAPASARAESVPKPPATVAPPGGENTEGAGRPDHAEQIAVIGIGCRFPGGANSLESLARVMHGDTDPVRPVPAGRWPELEPSSDLLARTGREAGFLDDVDRLRRGVLRHPAPRGRVMDPQQRLLLEVAWEALEDAGGRPGRAGRQPDRRLRRRQRRRVRARCRRRPGPSTRCTGDRQRALSIVAEPALVPARPARAQPGRRHRLLVVAGRRCTWPCQSLRAGRVRPGAGRRRQPDAPPAVTIALRAGRRMLAPDGRCQTFDAARRRLSSAARAAAWSCSSGCPTPSATATGCSPWSAAARQPGRAHQRAGGPQPAGPGGACIARRVRRRRLSTRPRSTTSRPTAPARRSATRSRRGRWQRSAARAAPPTRPLPIGSVKSNIGPPGGRGRDRRPHQGGAGPAARRPSRRTCHFTRPNPHIPLDDSGGCGCPASRNRWPARTVRRRRGLGVRVRRHQRPRGARGGARAGARKPVPPQRNRVVCVLSDHDLDRVRDQAAGLARWLGDRPDTAPRDVAGTVNRRGERGPARAALVAGDRGELRAGLAALGAGRPSRASRPAPGTRRPGRECGSSPVTARTGRRWGAGCSTPNPPSPRRSTNWSRSFWPRAG